MIPTRIAREEEQRVTERRLDGERKAVHQAKLEEPAASNKVRNHSEKCSCVRGGVCSGCCV